MHAIGTTLGVTVVLAALILGHPWYALLFFPIGYGFAWTGHFLVEKNKPATFGHPFWSFISDFRMLGLMFTGRLARECSSSDPSFTTPPPPRACYTRRKIMRVLGIDCGGEYTGYGVVEQDEQGCCSTYAAARSGYFRERRWKSG